MNGVTRMHYFIALDGDDVGPALRAFIVSNDLDALAAFSADISAHFSYLRQTLEESGYETIFCGGDSLLSHGMVKPAPSLFSGLRNGHCTVSVGVAPTAEQAYLALQLAKARGKRQAVMLTEASMDTVHVWSGEDSP